jgi:hypothetical protein
LLVKFRINDEVHVHINYINLHELLFNNLNPNISDYDHRDHHDQFDVINNAYYCSKHRKSLPFRIAPDVDILIIIYLNTYGAH